MVISYLDNTLQNAHHCTGKLEIVKTKSTVNDSWKEVYGLIWHGQTIANIDVNPPVPIMEFETYHDSSSDTWGTIIGVFSTQQTISENTVLKVTINGITNELKWSSLNCYRYNCDSKHHNFYINGNAFKLSEAAGQILDFEISW